MEQSRALVMGKVPSKCRHFDTALMTVPSLHKPLNSSILEDMTVPAVTFCFMICTNLYE